MSESVYERITAARHALAGAGFRPDDAALDAEVLAREALGWDRARLVAHGREPAPAAFDGRYQQMIERRLAREPVAMIVGHREFWGRDFAVTRATLVPRPETELIVEEALRLLAVDARSTIVDIGTGTGCLAVSLAAERPGISVVATDISHEALLVARTNAVRQQVAERVRFVQADLADGLALQADIVVSNPPYVPDKAAPALPPDVVRYEPWTALFGGSDGLAVLRRIFRTVPFILSTDGYFIVEFGLGQEDDVRLAAESAGWRVERVLHDFQGIARTLVVRR
jgi:release factor glutamine methyltransferase